jgi:hypothetical protein
MERLAEGSSDNPLCKQTIAELRPELTSPSTGLGMVRLSDAKVRVYLSSLLEAFDERVTSMRPTGE